MFKYMLQRLPIIYQNPLLSLVRIIGRDMKKFRNLKNNLVGSKRDSQKIDQVQIERFQKDILNDHAMLNSINASLQLKLHHQMQMITQDHYKITQTAPHSSHPFAFLGSDQNYIQNSPALFQRQKIEIELLKLISESSPLQEEDCCNNGRTQELKRNLGGGEVEEGNSRSYDCQQTIKKDRGRRRLPKGKKNSTTHKYQELVQLLSKLNALERMKENVPSSNNQSSFESQISIKKIAIHALIEQLTQEESLQSIKTLTDRVTQAGEKQDEEANTPLKKLQIVNHHSFSKEEEGKSSIIRYKRINMEDVEYSNFEVDDSEHYVNQTFSSEEEGESLNGSPFQTLQERSEPQVEGWRCNQKQIVHLYSYEKEKQETTPLSKITERSSESVSSEYDSFKSSNGSLREESIEYKKILYLLETTERKQRLQRRQSIKSSNSNSKNRHAFKISDLSKISPNDSGLLSQEQFQFSSQEVSSNPSSQSSDRVSADLYPTKSQGEHSKASSEALGKRETLKQIVSLLQNKYHRKVNLQSLDPKLAVSITSAMENHRIRPRAKK